MVDTATINYQMTFAELVAVVKLLTEDYNAAVVKLAALGNVSQSAAYQTLSNRITANSAAIMSLQNKLLTDTCGVTPPCPPTAVDPCSEPAIMTQIYSNPYLNCP